MAFSFWTLRSFNQLLLILASVIYFTEGNFVADETCSPSSVEQLFNSLDSNFDGIIEESDIHQLISEFGGESLEKPEEIKRSVKSVLAHMDTNHDGMVTGDEARAFWRGLGVLLSVNEVVSWVVHGIQMPESIGELFCENMVSGYDFAELIEDNGAGLDELGITKLAHKKKLVRSIKMLLSGAGETPSAPLNPRVEGISTQSAKLSWSTSDGFGFPIHKYRVFRRSGDKQKSNHNVCKLLENTRKDWILVYDGPSNEFIDTGLISGFQYEYQCEAWSLFGHSEIITFSGSPLLTPFGSFKSRIYWWAATLYQHPLLATVVCLFSVHFFVMNQPKKD